MPAHTRIKVAVCALAVMAALQTGCAQVPARPSDELRSSFGTIGAGLDRVALDSDVDAPTSGKASGAAKGSVAGILVCIGGGLESGNPLGAAVGFLVTPLGAVVGAVYGGVTAESGNAVALAADAINGVLSGYDVQGDILAHVCEMTDGLTEYRFVNIGDLEKDDAGAVPYGRLKGDGVDTVLELAVERFGFEGKKAEAKPEIMVAMDVRARLVRTADGVELYSRTFTYRSKKRFFTDWGRNNAAKFRISIDKANDVISGDIVRELFVSRN